MRAERLLADARDAQMRNESVVAISTLAAAYVHELSVMVVNENGDRVGS